MSASSLWFSLSLDISTICFIISCGLGCPVALVACVAVSASAAAGDVAGLCANEEVAIIVANRIVIKDVNVFMRRILPPKYVEWQVPNESGKTKITKFVSARCRNQHAS